MKKELNQHRQGSVLLVALLTITIMTLICATSLYVGLQNTNAGIQTSAWQQALSGAENGMTRAINALNLNAQGTSGAWSNWYANAASSLPNTQPSGGTACPSATPAPTANQYYYLPLTAIAMQGESNNNVGGWVTVDNIPGMTQTTGGVTYPWYRIRATGTASAATGSWRRWVSNNRLDSELRKISLNFDRAAGGNVGTPKATRTIEVIAQPSLVTSGGGGYGWVMAGAIKFSGMAMMDSFNSNYGSYASQAIHTYNGPGGPVTYANANMQVATQDSTGSNFNSQLIFGNAIYSGPTLKGTSYVQGTVSTPYAGTIAPVTDPTGGPWTTISSGTQMITTGSGTNYYKVSGDLTMSTGQTITAKQGSGSGTIILWVTGNINLSGMNNIVVQQGVTLKIYGDGQQIYFFADSFNNQNVNGAGGPMTNTLYLYGTNTSVGASKTNVSDDPAHPGTGTFVGVIDEPAYYFNDKSAGNFYGSITGNNTQTSGAASYHYDEALGTGSSGSTTSVSNYAYATWFEDNSDPNRKDGSGNTIIY